MTLRELAIWFMAVLVAARMGEGVASASASDWLGAIGSHNLIYVLAYMAALSRFWAMAPDLRISPPDAVAFAAAALYLVVVSPLSLWLLDGVAIVLLGIYLMSKRQIDQNLFAAGIVLCALGANLFLGRIVMLAFQSQVVAIDAFVVQQALWLSGDIAPRVGNRVVSENGFSISIIGACSAFNNITLILLAIVSAIIWVRPQLHLSDLKWLLAGAGVMLFLNTLRLSLMANGLESYRYWHNDAGGLYFGAAQTVIALLIAYLAAHRGRGRAVAA